MLPKRAGGFVLDMSEVERNMRRLNKRILPTKIRWGLTLAGSKLMTDVIVVEPTAPIRRSEEWPMGYPPGSERLAGELRASGALFVDGVKKGDTVKRGEKATGRYQPLKYGGTRIPLMSHEACVVFNAPYAVEQHEAWPDKTEPGAGQHYLSKKLYGNAVEYIGIVAEVVRL